jgi:hypothetical protein
VNGAGAPANASKMPKWAEREIAMSTVKVSYRLTGAARHAEGVRTGNVPDEKQVVEVELSALNTEQREAVLAAPGHWQNDLGTVELGNPQTGQYYLYADRILDADAVVALCAELVKQAKAKQAERDAERTAELVKTIERKTAKIRDELIAQHSTNVNDWYCLSGDEKRDCERLGIDHAALYSAWNEFKDRQPEFRAEKKARDEVDAARAEQAKIEKAKADEAERQERLAWAKEHGSERLRRILEGGYEAGRLYWVERCAVEYPGCILDYEKNAETKERIAPKIKELDALDELEVTHPDADVKIVWLTAEPLAYKRDEEDDFDSDFEPCAALEIDDPDYERFIYKLL